MIQTTPYAVTASRLLRATCVVSGTLALAACGGGGSGDDSTASNGGAPSAGPYAWVLKAEGPTSSLTYGLSLVSASRPGTEFAVESGSSVLTDTRTVSSGSVDVAGLATGALQAQTLVYIVGGDVRRVPLQANGSLPSTLVERAGTSTLCNFLVDANGHAIGDAVDYATPENSRFLATTAGADGQCGTSDDGAAEVRLGAGAITAATAGTNPLGMFRDAATLAPRGWIYPKSVVYWTTGAGLSVVTRTDAEASFTAAVEAAPTAALMDDGTQLSVLDFSATANAPVETRLDATITGGGGWVGIGFDATNWYAYRNTGSGTAGQWTLIKVARTSPFAAVLGTGMGEISVASMGTGLLYATVLGTGGNNLLAVSKSVGVPLQTLESTPTSTLTTVQTSAAGVHELWRIVNIGTAALNYAIEFIDETGARLYTTNAGGYPIVSPDAEAQRFDTSESRTRFVFANGYGSRAFGDAALMGFDATAKTGVIFGALPGSATFGTGTVYANATGGPGDLMGGFAAQTTNGTIASAGAQVFSFNFATAQSLQLTTATD